MKFFIKVIIFFLFFLNNINASEKIAFVDIDLIINSSDLGKKLSNDLNKKIQAEDKRLKEKEKKLKTDEDKLLKQKNILSEDELKKLLAELKTELNSFRQERVKVNNEIRKRKLEETNFLLTSLNNILANYAEENSLSLVIQKKNIVIGKTELDITKDILKIFKSEVKSISK